MRKIKLIILLILIVNSIVSLAQSVDFNVTNYPESTIYTNQTSVTLNFSTVATMPEGHNAKQYDLLIYQNIGNSNDLGEQLLNSHNTSSPVSSFTIKYSDTYYGKFFFLCRVDYTYIIDDITRWSDYPCEDALNKTIVFDDQNPTTPTNLVASNIEGNSIELTWGESTDNKVLGGYLIYQNDVYLKTVTDNNTTITNLEPCTSYNFKIIAFDKADNRSQSLSSNFGTISDIPVTRTLANDYSAIPDIDYSVFNGLMGLSALQTVVLQPGFRYSPEYSSTSCLIYIGNDCSKSESESKTLSPQELIYPKEIELLVEIDKERIEVCFNNVLDPNIEEQIKNATIANINSNEIKNLNSSLQNEYKIYPNPTKNNLHIISDLNVNKLKLFNSQGIIVVNKNFDRNTVVNISNLTSGIYILEIEQQNGERIIKRIIKQ